MSSHLLAIPRASQHSPYCSISDPAPVSPERLRTSRIPSARLPSSLLVALMAQTFPACLGGQKNQLKKLVIRVFWKNQQPERAD